MAKVHTLTAIFTAASLIIMILLMVIGIDFSKGDGFTEFIKNNQGLIWAVFTVAAISGVVLEYISIQSNRDLKECNDLNNKLLEQVASNQSDIVGKLNENAARDNETLREVVELRKDHHILERSHKNLEDNHGNLESRVGEIEGKVQEHTTKISNNGCEIEKINIKLEEKKPSDPKKKTTRKTT